MHSAPIPLHEEAHARHKRAQFLVREAFADTDSMNWLVDHASHALSSTQADAIVAAGLDGYQRAERALWWRIGRRVGLLGFAAGLGVALLIVTTFRLLGAAA